MKRLIIPALGLLFITQVYAQDILTLRSGKKYEVKILEITNTDLRFKMYNNLDGPLYTIKRNSFSSVRYANGVTEDLAVQPLDSAETISVNGYNTSASASAGGPNAPFTVNTPEESTAPTRYAVSQKRTNIGEVVNAIVVTGLMALDIAAKVEARQYVQRTAHAHAQYGCRHK